MQTSILRRAPHYVIALALVALVMGVLSFSKSDNAEATLPTEFAAVTTTSLSATTANTAGVDVIQDLTIPSGDLNFSAYVSFLPQNAVIAEGPGTPGFGAGDPVLGDIMGLLGSVTTLGITNAACVPAGTLNFRLLNGTTSQAVADEIAPLDPAVAPSTGVLDNMRLDDDGDTVVEASDSNGLPNHVDHYPDYLKTLFPIQPHARYTARLNVLGTEVVVQFLVFAPGAFAGVFGPTHPLSDLTDPKLGWSSVTVLQDPTQPASPSAVTDFCSPLGTNAKTEGISQTNPCVATPASCTTDALRNFPTPGADTGRVRFTNPPAGQAYAYAFQQSARDLDKDGLEQGFDTCPYQASSVGFDPRLSGAGGIGGAHDADADNIPDYCDPSVGDTNSGNHDGDGIGTGLDNKQWLNAGDGCPLIGTGPDSELNDEGELPQYVTDNVSRPRGGSQTDGIPDTCDVAESGAQCSDALDNEANLAGTVVGPDGLINDGCPAVGAPEVGCLNDADDDSDGFVNDGCPSSKNVSTGYFRTVLSVSAICIGAAGVDTDGDGFCNATETLAGSCAAAPCNAPFVGSPAPATSTPEHYGLTFPFPIAHSGSGLNPGTDREPQQVCNDAIDNDKDGKIDIMEGDGPDTGTFPDCTPFDAVLASGAAPSSLGDDDTDGDGINNAKEIWIGTDALGRCEVGGSTVSHVPSGDWPIDLSGVAPPTTLDRVNIVDLNEINKRNGSGPTVTPPGKLAYAQRYDINPGPPSFSPGAAGWINIVDFQDLAFTVPSAAPFNGAARAFGGPACTADPVLND